MSANNQPPFNEARSNTSVFQIEIYTRRSMLEGFSWVIGTNQEGDIVQYDGFTNNLAFRPYRGIDAVSVDTSMHIDPSGRQTPNNATVNINENIIVYAQKSSNLSSEKGFINFSNDGNSLNIAESEQAARNFQDNVLLTAEGKAGLSQENQQAVLLTETNSINATNAAQAAGSTERPSVITPFIVTEESTLQQATWMRIRTFIETELSPNDRIVIKSLSETLQEYTTDWQQALKPIFTGYITEINSSGSAGGDETISLSCACNLRMLDISKFNVAPTLMPSGYIDRLTNSFFGAPSLDATLTERQALNPNAVTIDPFIDGLDASERILFDGNAVTFAKSELINQDATSLLIRALTTDAFETSPILKLQNKTTNKDTIYYLQSGVTQDQLSYNNILDQEGGDNSPLISNFQYGPNGRIETVVGIPFFNGGVDVNSSLMHYAGEWKTLLEIAGDIASNMEMEFFADESGRIVLKFPTHSEGINLCPNNDILPNPLCEGKKIPLVIQDRNISAWNFVTKEPVCTVVKAVFGTGTDQLNEESLVPAVVVVRFNGLTTLGGIPIDGGENLVQKYGVRAQILPPTQIYLPGTFLGTVDSQNQLAKATLIQYATMKGGIMNDLIRHTGTVTTMEDSLYTVGQPVIIEHRLRQGDFTQDFGAPSRDFYYVQGITRSISVGRSPTMTLSLTAGRRYAELTQFERSYFSFYQYIARRHPLNFYKQLPQSSEFDIAALQGANSVASSSRIFFQADLQNGVLLGPDKETLLSVTGDPQEPYNTKIHTRRITKRNYQDLSPQVNILTTNSTGWSSRADSEKIKLLFTRPSGRTVGEGNSTRIGDYEYAVEPLLKINTDSDLFPNLSETLNIFPDPNTQPGQILDSYLLKRILNDDINLI